MLTIAESSVTGLLEREAYIVRPPLIVSKLAMSDRKFATLSGLGKSERRSRSPSSSGGSSDDEKRRQGFYVGGSEHSGQQVLGPSSSSRAGREDLIAQVFDAARAHGAETLTPEENARRGTQNAIKFGSGGYRLGDSHRPSESVPAVHANDDQPEQQEVTLTMWENGFSVDDGPLRQFDDPENRSFLQSIMQGRIPMELVRLYPSRTIDLRMERKSEAYKAPKPKPFSGHGQRLGDIVPPVLGAGVVGQKTSTAVDAVKQAQDAITLRDGEPTTQVQIRLPNGRRIIGRFSHSHTVEEVRSFIVAAIPEFAFQPFCLMTTFPSKVIEAERETLKDAGLLNSVIVVRHT
ncbi:NSFL1 cofactor p47 [Toxocara canis]|uniref:NSFL1 cofactor p47 n=1 Tax=Toxocara canis TaxID=6265 RepID=A0A0B2V258_TOXCA|nr:NSFL1 cofactor p47 [Toxocara canis]